MTVQPTDFVLEFSPWSVSKANTAEQCPHRFYLSYVKKEKRAFTSADALVGQAAHKLIEYLLLGVNIDRALASVIAEYELMSAEEDRVKDMVPSACNFYDNYLSYCKKFDVKETLVEKQLAIDINGKPVKYFDNDKAFLRGVVDLALLFKPHPHAMIIDHKTGSQKDLGYYSNQFDVYRILMKAHYPELTGLITGINWVKEDFREFDKFKPISSVEPTLSKFINYLNAATQLTSDYDRANVGPLCGWCDHKTICKKFRTANGTEDQDRQEAD